MPRRFWWRMGSSGRWAQQPETTHRQRWPNRWICGEKHCCLHLWMPTAISWPVPNAMLQLSVAQAENFAELQDMMRTHIRKTGLPAGQWLLVRDFDPSNLQEQRIPDRTVLDQAAPEHPVVLQHRSGHVGVLNTLALQKMHITAKTPDPVGGHIERSDAGPTGYLEENAFLNVLNQLPPPELEQLLARPVTGRRTTMPRLHHHRSGGQW